MVIGTDCIDSCKWNFHTTTTKLKYEIVEHHCLFIMTKNNWCILLILMSFYLRLSIDTMRGRYYPLIVNNRSATNVVPTSTASQLKRHLPRVVTDVSIRTSNNTTYSIYIYHLFLIKYVYITLVISVSEWVIVV